MSEENKCDCEFCKWNALRKKALESGDIEFVKKVLIDFADLWLNTDFELSYCRCILDGSWTTAEEMLTASLEKA